MTVNNLLEKLYTIHGHERSSAFDPPMTKAVISLSSKFVSSLECLWPQPEEINTHIEYINICIAQKYVALHRKFKIIKKKSIWNIFKMFVKVCRHNFHDKSENQLRAIRSIIFNVMTTKTSCFLKINYIDSF